MQGAEKKNIDGDRAVSTGVVREIETETETETETKIGTVVIAIEIGIVVTNATGIARIHALANKAS